MVFIKARKKQLLLTGSLAVAVTALTITACGGGGAASPAQGSAPGQWTQAEVSQFTAAAGGTGSASENSCIFGDFERDMSFGSAMAVVSVAPVSGPSMSPAQIEAAVVSKYGATEGDAINAQFKHVDTDAVTNCDGSAASSTATAAPAPTADPAAASESSWLAQVQGALQNVHKDLDSISSDASNSPDSLGLDGSQLEGGRAGRS